MRCGKPLPMWPSRVVIVPYGKHHPYAANVQMWDFGASNFMAVDHPRDLIAWASRNHLQCADWNLLAWLPNDPAKSLRAPLGVTGLDGKLCWDSVFPDPLVSKLILSILQSPADIVLS